MAPEDFAVEEYRQLYEEVKRHQTSYTRLEILTLTSMVLIYGFLWSSRNVVQWPIWYAVPLAAMVPALRCGAYYFLINFRLAPYLADLENAIYGGRMRGYQNSVTISKSRILNLTFNTLVWTCVIAGSVCIAIWHQPIFGK